MAKGKFERTKPHVNVGALGSVNNFGRRLVDQFVIKRLEADANFLLGRHFYSWSVQARGAPHRRVHQGHELMG